MCLKQTVLLGYILLQLFCIYSFLILLLILYTDMEMSSWQKRIIQTELHICHENYKESELK
jgi:hypothetical protein